MSHLLIPCSKRSRFCDHVVKKFGLPNNLATLNILKLKLYHISSVQRGESSIKRTNIVRVGLL